MLYVSLILWFKQKKKSQNKLDYLTPLSTYNDVICYTYGLAFTHIT